MGITKKVASLLLTLAMVVAIIPVSVFAANKGWVKSGSYWYYYESSGKMAMGWKQIGKTWYFFDDDYGFMYSDEWRWEENSKGKYVGYYFASSGAMQKNKWKLYGDGDDGWTYLTSDGSTAIGWQKIGKSWYFFDNQDYVSNPHYGLMVTDNYIEGGYRVDKDGKMLANKWHLLYDGGTYHDWLYFDASGKMAQNGWRKIGKKWYYFHIDGVAACGFLTLNIDGKLSRYIFDPMNANMLTGWVQRGINWYYAGSDGNLYVNCSAKINGKTYNFDSWGHCTNP